MNGVVCAILVSAAANVADADAMGQILRPLHVSEYEAPASGEPVEGVLFARIPTSFRYGGAPSHELLSEWPRTASAPVPVPGGTRYAFTWAAPDGFEARLDATVFDAPPAAEFQWLLSNMGDSSSDLVTDAQAIDLEAPSAEGRCVLHSCMGGTTGGLKARPGAAGFELTTTPLGEKRMSVDGGRSSNGSLPFFCLDRFAGPWGVSAGLGWSGQWKGRAWFDATSKTARLRVGLAPVHFRLPPGESVRMPSALFVPFRGETRVGKNALRHVLRTRYQGRIDGKLIPPPVSFSSWFVFKNDVNAKMLTEIADVAAPLGIEYLCLDAGWFEGDFPRGVGNWTVNRDKFPSGLKAVADHLHGLGMKFGLWFEPERVSEGTHWYEEHGDLLYPARAAGDRRLLDLGKPEAQRLIVDMVSRYVGEVGVDWIRYDFNLAPLGFWEDAESDEEQGLVQIRYMNGLYDVLAELMDRHPGLLIEQCASGGRRIDLETIRYGHTFWKSDDTRTLPLLRFHETGGNEFLFAGALNSNYCESVSPGDVLSLFAGPLGFGLDLRETSPADRAFLKEAIAAYKNVREYLNADYYPLFPQSRDETRWAGWQFVDPVTGSGFFAAYRPASSNQHATDIALRAVRPEAMHRVSDVMTGEAQSLSGADLLRGLEVELAPGGATARAFRPE